MQTAADPRCTGRNEWQAAARDGEVAPSACGDGIRALTRSRREARPAIDENCYLAQLVSRTARTSMSIHLALQPLIALIAGILILIVPRLLNYVVAIYLIIVGLIGLLPMLHLS
jgi:hypothetical protein